MNDAVLTDSLAGVTTITLNRPHTRNAVNDDMLDGLLSAFNQARDDIGVRAVILTGAGRGFCSGADLSVFGNHLSAEDIHAYITERYQPIIRAITTLPKPVVAAINGVAAGAGASLALACDLRIMADDASLVQAFSSIGLVPDAGSTWFLVRMIGYGRAFELAAEAERVPAARCLELGLANQVVTPETLQIAARARAEKLAQRPTLALGLIKQALHRALEVDLMDAIDFEARLQGQTIQSHDHREGVSAFLEKRQPQFTGT
jgi:2-(1,2-epoxy-1,2-dihydrophenyl)acetyl-CoA isomerase